MSAKRVLSYLLLAWILVLAVPAVMTNVFKHNASSPESARESRIFSGKVVTMTTEQQALTSHLAKKYKKPEAQVEKVVTAAYKYGKEHKVSPLLVLAVVEKESSFRPEVVNTYGAVGLMQVVPRWHPEKFQTANPVKELQKPENNIRVGARILSEYLQAKKGNVQAALKKYSGDARQYAERVENFKKGLQAVVREHKKKTS